MEKEFVPYEQALALKELGFDEECFSFYDNLEMLVVSEFLWKNSYSKGKDVVAPLYQQAFRWFREKYDILHNIFFIEIDDINKFSASLKKDYDKKWIHLGFIQNVNTYEEAELECLVKLIEIVKN